MNSAILYLEDGVHFFGQSLSVQGSREGEIIFNTSMTGYQEILTDPSYAGQIVIMTYPLIGNYGVNEEDVESRGIFLKGFIVKEFCRRHSNYRATKSLIEYLNENNILAIEGIDTRALTRHIREKGAMRCIISTEDLDLASLKNKMNNVPSMEGSNWAQAVTTDKQYIWDQGVDQWSPLIDPNNLPEQKFIVAAIDCGIKYNIMRILTGLGCQVHVFPASASIDEIKAINPDGFFVSNGPGDPAAVVTVIEIVKSFLGKIPIFGICLGHQIIGLALGAKTYKLKFGHHGANHPVKDMVDESIGITAQNHGFCVDADSLGEGVIDIVDINLNDQTLEGIKHLEMPILSFQHHPEASPGPHDVEFLFHRFIEMMDNHSKKNTEVK